MYSGPWLLVSSHLEQSKKRRRKKDIYLSWPSYSSFATRYGVLGWLAMSSCASRYARAKMAIRLRYGYDTIRRPGQPDNVRLFLPKRCIPGDPKGDVHDAHLGQCLLALRRAIFLISFVQYFLPMARSLAITTTYSMYRCPSLHMSTKPCSCGLYGRTLSPYPPTHDFIPIDAALCPSFFFFLVFWWSRRLV